MKSEKLGERLQELVTVGGGNGHQGNGLLKQAIEIGLGAGVPAVLNRVDFSSVDVNKITHQLQKLTEKFQDVDVDKITSR